MQAQASERGPAEWSALKIDQSRSLADQDLGVIVLSVDFQMSGGTAWQRFHDLNAFEEIIIGRQARFSRDKYYWFTSEVAKIRTATPRENQLLQVDISRDTPVCQGIAIDLHHGRAAYALRPGTYVLMDIHAGIGSVDRRFLGDHGWDQQNAATSIRFTVKAGEIAYLEQIKIVVPVASAAAEAANGGEVLGITIEDRFQQDRLQIEKAVRKIVGPIQPIILHGLTLISPTGRFPTVTGLQPPAPLTQSQIDVSRRPPPR